jgi:demethylmenaquinone methyltransferase/2-methoxy-6-polyprenyl-1,4-benzoquinol methylase
LESAELVDYYRRRAAQYEAIYAKPERQPDLARLRDRVCAAFAGRHVLEIACGTGYWTQVIAAVARGIVAADLAEEPMTLARAKRYVREPAFVSADAYALPEALGRFDAAFAGFWWSHLPLGRIGEFLSSLHARLRPGARVMMLDNRYVEGSSTPIAGVDAQGNSYQLRHLADGGALRVLKNFPSAADLRARLAPYARQMEVEELEYYWLLDYRLLDDRLP